MALEIWHNPRCSKSRATLAMIEEAGVEHRVRRYLDDPPSREEIFRALRLLGLTPAQLLRAGEPIARQLGLGDPGIDEDRLIDAMSENPVLIERPVVIDDDGRAVLGRPPENVRELL